MISQGVSGGVGPVGLQLRAWALSTDTAILVGNNVLSITFSTNYVFTFNNALPSNKYIVRVFGDGNSATDYTFFQTLNKTTAKFDLRAYDKNNVTQSISLVHFEVWG